MSDINIIYEEYPGDLANLKFPYIPCVVDFSHKELPKIYDKGFIAFGSSLKMARSVRVKLSSFTLNSENRRLFRNAESFHPKLIIQKKSEVAYIHEQSFINECIAFAKERYVDGGTLNAEKYYEIYNNSIVTHVATLYFGKKLVGTVFICYMGEMAHYWHAFYDLELNKRHKLSLGKYLMLTLINHLKELGALYIYLGAAYDQDDYYKINDWNSLQWWTGESWSDDASKIQELCKAKL